MKQVNAPYSKVIFRLTGLIRCDAATELCENIVGVALRGHPLLRGRDSFSEVEAPEEGVATECHPCKVAKQLTLTSLADGS